MNSKRKLKKYKAMKSSVVLLLGLLGVLLASCISSRSQSAGSTASKQTSTTQTSTTGLNQHVSLSETGSTLLYPLFNLWVPAIEKKYPNISITTAGTGSGTGIAEASQGTVDIGASDAYLSPGEFQKYPDLENIALAISAQMINYNVPGVTANLKLTGKVISQMYQGKITNWNDPQIQSLNPGVSLPNLAVAPLHRTESSGDTFLFSSFLSATDPNGWGSKIGAGTSVAFPVVANATGEQGNSGMVTGCQKTPGCIAYIGISYYNQTKSANLGEAELQNAAGNFVLPNSQTIQAEAANYVSKTPANEAVSLIYGPGANSYPIINYEYAIVQTSQPNANTAAAIRTVLSWAISPDGGSSPNFLNQAGFQPLPSPVAKLSQNLINKIS